MPSRATQPLTFDEWRRNPTPDTFGQARRGHELRGRRKLEGQDEGTYPKETVGLVGDRLRCGLRRRGRRASEEPAVHHCQGTKRDAERKLAEKLGNVTEGTFVEPDKITFGEWLLTWFEIAIKGKKKLRTVETYDSVIRQHLIPALGAIPLQKLTAVNLERYYAEKKKTADDTESPVKKLSPATLEQHSTIIHSALASAERKKLVHRNEAKLVDGKPRRDTEDVRANCWEADEAKQFLEVARKAGPQRAAFYTLALESGMRKGEIVGLRWQDVDLDARTVTVARQLLRPGSEPVFGSPKSKSAKRTINISPETAQLLAEHKRHQAEVKMAHRTSYRDQGLVFAKEEGKLGDPLQSNNLGQREFAKLIREAGVKLITIHGLRHTSATLALKAGTPVHVVSQRLGHKKIEITLNVYAHALPSMQKDAARKLSELLR